MRRACSFVHSAHFIIIFSAISNYCRFFPAIFPFCQIVYNVRVHAYAAAIDHINFSITFAFTRLFCTTHTQSMCFPTSHFLFIFDALHWSQWRNCCNWPRTKFTITGSNQFRPWWVTDFFSSSSQQRHLLCSVPLYFHHEISPPLTIRVCCPLHGMIAICEIAIRNSMLSYFIFYRMQQAHPLTPSD